MKTRGASRRTGRSTAWGDGSPAPARGLRVTLALGLAAVSLLAGCERKPTAASAPAATTDTKEAIRAQIAELRAANLGGDYLNAFKPEEIDAVRKRFDAIAPYFIRK